MSNITKAISLGLLICTLPLTAQAAPEKKDRALIEPGKVHEVCMDLEFGRRLTYAFISSREMNFNIHYHEGEEVAYPIADHLTKEKNEIFTAQSNQGYCMMWTNPNDKPSRLNVIYKVR
ncbi:MAG: hypothetical protein HOH19_09430 [Kordiimonadaceae bacterium]|jgi:hypothetical protein|nr:hypothetical protein [Kordiimonadaceae bacterium]MBT6032784.1 hypothetical protein [Kordiimonadaceae bacterium]